MKKFLKIFIVLVFLLVLIAAAYYFLNPKKAIKLIFPELKRVGYVHVKLIKDTAMINLDIEMRNAGFFKLTVDSLNYRVRFDTALMLSRRQLMGIELNVNQSDTFRLPVRLPYKRLIKEIKRLQNTDSANINVDLEVIYSTLLGRAVLPYSREIRIEVPVPPEIKILKTDFVRRDGKVFYAEARMEIKNEGNLDLLISGLKYNMKVEDLFTASGADLPEVRLKPHRDTIYTLPIKIEFKKLLKTAVKVLTNHDVVSYHLVVSGFVKTSKSDDKVPMEVEKRDKLELKK